MPERQQEPATTETWWSPPQGGWTYDQVKDLELPFDWELVDGVIVVRGQPVHWHDWVKGGLYRALWNASKEPLAVTFEACLMVDKNTVIKPDGFVYDKRGLDLFTMDCVPSANVKLVVEIVSPGSRTDDRARKPAILAESKVPYYWRIERGEDNLPEVHEYWLHADQGSYIPAPEHPVHRQKLVAEHPFPVEIDRRSLVEF